MVDDANETPPAGGTTISSRYSAPALEKGLDILELLAGADGPLTASQITQALGRSMSELFRMIQVLEHRGFIEQAGDRSGYKPTDRLLRLGMEQAPMRNLLECALPAMRSLSTAIGQSCHLMVRSGADMVTVARMESGEQLGFTVRVGYRRPLIETHSGAVLFAFQNPDDQQRWIAQFSRRIPRRQIAEFTARVDRIRAQGHEQRESRFTKGITDLSAPILRAGIAAAALTVPFVHSTQLSTPIDVALDALKQAAAGISAMLLSTDHRV